jgi:hypothetical protein
MRSSARIAPGLDIAPEQARDARARAWKFVFDCHAKKNATSVPGANGGEDVRLAITMIPEGAREYWERMYPDEQPTRERWLCEHRRSAQEIRGRRTSVMRFPRTDRGEGGSY